MALLKVFGESVWDNNAHRIFGYILWLVELARAANHRNVYMLQLFYILGNLSIEVQSITICPDGAGRDAECGWPRLVQVFQFRCLHRILCIGLEFFQRQYHASLSDLLLYVSTNRFHYQYVSWRSRARIYKKLRSVRSFLSTSDRRTSPALQKHHRAVPDKILDLQPPPVHRASAVRHRPVEESRDRRSDRDIRVPDL